MNDTDELLQQLRKVYNNLTKLRKITDTLPDLKTQDESNNCCDKLHTLTEQLKIDVETLAKQTKTQE